MNYSQSRWIKFNVNTHITGLLIRPIGWATLRSTESQAPGRQINYKGIDLPLTAPCSSQRLFSMFLCFRHWHLLPPFTMNHHPLFEPLASQHSPPDVFSQDFPSHTWCIGGSTSFCGWLYRYILCFRIQVLNSYFSFSYFSYWKNYMQKYLQTSQVKRGDLLDELGGST